MKNPITALVEAYLKGRSWQMERLDKQNSELKRIADALEAIASS